MENIRVANVRVFDVRFPTSLQADGSDSMHTDPDYSCAYVVIETNNNLQGYGLTFTLGRGTEIGKIFICLYLEQTSITIGDY